MYVVTLHNPGITPVEIHGNIEKLQSGKVVQGINSIDSFTFSMLPSNVGFALIKDFKTLVKVFNTNTQKTTILKCEQKASILVLERQKDRRPNGGSCLER